MNYEQLHKELWKWLANNPDKEKQQWPEWKCNRGGVDGVIECCFACKAAYDRSGGRTAKQHRCTYCPLLASPQCAPDSCLNGLFADWYFSEDVEKKVRLALEIMNLEWRE